MDRPANDIDSEARTVHEVYLIDPATKKPTGPGGGGSISAVATAAAPAYEEGESEPLSMDLAGNLRIGGTISAETATTATAAAPSYVEASADNPLSVNLSGDLRTIAKQSGAWTVAATQSGTWNVTNISGTVSLPTGASTAANQTAITGSKAAGTAAASSILTGGVFNTSLPTLTNGQQAAAQMDASGRIYTAATQSGTWNVTNISGTVSLPTGAATAALQGVQGTGATYNPPTGGSGEIGYLSGIYAAAVSTSPTVVAQEATSWVHIPASSTDTAAGNANDLLDSLLVIPATTSPGAVSIEDGAGTNYTLFAGGASSVSTLIPFPIDMRNIAAGTGWEITTGANVAVIAFYRARA